MSDWKSLILRIPTIDALVAPTGTAISGSAVIGQTLTASATGTVTSWQWKRGGSDIGGATNSTYVLVDADFGYAITVTATNAGGSDTSAATALVAEAPAESLGAELLTNSDFSAWTADNPGSWTVSGESGSNPMVTQVAADGSAGTGAARFYSSATNFSPSLVQLAFTPSAYHECVIDLSAYTSGTLGYGDQSSLYATFTSTGVRRFLARASHENHWIQARNAPSDFVVNSDSIKLITLNAQLTAPSANMRLTQFYTLPASPIAEDHFWLPLRISDWSTGNYWLVLLTYTGSQWNINLYSVASHARTSRVAATNIGATNGVRINANGDNWTLETTADGGANWTSRGTVTNATYNTATGVNALWTSGFTAGNLAYEAAV